MKQKHVREMVLNFFSLLVLVAIVLNLFDLSKSWNWEWQLKGFSVHPENGIEYLIESNCLRQEKEENAALKIFFFLIAEQ